MFCLVLLLMLLIKYCYLPSCICRHNLLHEPRTDQIGKLFVTSWYMVRSLWYLYCALLSVHATIKLASFCWSIYAAMFVPVLHFLFHCCVESRFVSLRCSFNYECASCIRSLGLTLVTCATNSFPFQAGIVAKVASQCRRPLHYQYLVSFSSNVLEPAHFLWFCRNICVANEYWGLVDSICNQPSPRLPFVKAVLRTWSSPSAYSF